MLCVRFFAHEGMRHDGKPIHDWLFELAKSMGIKGGSAFRASAGYGRHGLHEDTFFELAGTLPQTVEFFGEDETIRLLIEQVSATGLKLVYVTHPIDVGMTG